MSELCPDCYNKITMSNDAQKKFLISHMPELCEECGECKPVIIRLRTRYLIREWLEELTETTSQIKKQAE